MLIGFICGIRDGLAILGLVIFIKNMLDIPGLGAIVGCHG